MTAINKSQGRGLAHIDRSTLLNVILIFVTQQFQNEQIYILCSTPKYKPLTLLVLQGAGDGYSTNFRSDVVVKNERFSTFMPLKRAELMT